MRYGVGTAGGGGIAAHSPRAASLRHPPRRTLAPPHGRHAPHPSPPPRMVGAPAPPRRRLPNWALGGLLAAFVGATFYTTIGNVTADDLEAELERELAEEDRRQRKSAATAAGAAPAPAR